MIVKQLIRYQKTSTCSTFWAIRVFATNYPVDASLFVDFRKRLGMESLNAINELIVKLKTKLEEMGKKSDSTWNENDNNPEAGENKGRIIFDATACPQDIAYPTDLNLLSEAREKKEQLIGQLFTPDLHEKKPRTYRRVARKRYLNTAQNKNKSRQEIRKAAGSQLRFVNRSLNSIDKLLDAYSYIMLIPKQHKCLLVVRTLLEQQKQMYVTHTNSTEDWIMSIHQPHVRPIVFGTPALYG